MASQVEGLNPEVLRWARERMGLSIAQLAQELGKAEDQVAGWENGIGAPTYNQLETLAYVVLKRPLAVFFFPTPPDEPQVRQSFRTLPDSVISDLSADTRFAIRLAKSMQLRLSELNSARNPNDRLIFRERKIGLGTDAKSSAQAIRTYLGVSLANQIAWGSTRTAFEAWRNAIQDRGIYIFKRSFKQKDFFGFCLTDAEFPVIFVNNSTAHSRQIFSLAHELAHILINENSTTQNATAIPEELVGDAFHTEIFCNAFAGELLVPADDFDRHYDATLATTELCDKLSKRYWVSREVIARKLLDRGVIRESTYRALSAQWSEEYNEQAAREKESGGGGNYFATQATYLGRKYLQLAFGQYHAGRISIAELADHLSVRAKNVAGLEPYALARGSR